MIRTKQNAAGTGQLPGSATDIEWAGIRQGRTIAANTTLNDKDVGTLVLATGGSGVTVTLPRMPVGSVIYIGNAVDQNLTVASAPSDNIVTFNDLAADSCAFSTGGEKIGGLFMCISVNVAGTVKWFIKGIGAGTVTVAT